MVQSRFRKIFCSLALTIVSFSNAVAHDHDKIEPKTELLVGFNSTIGELPNSITVLKDGSIAASFPFLHELRIYQSSTGEILRIINNLPAVTGITTDVNGDIFTASPSALLDPENAGQHGIWRIDLDHGSAKQIATLPQTTIPRSLVVADDGTIFAGDLTGRIYKIDDGFEPSIWLEHSLLQGSPDLPGPIGRPPFPVGIEGLHIKDGFLYGTVVDYGRIIRIPINADGSAGEIEIIVEKPEILLGLDEIALDDQGNIYGVSAFLHEVYKITPNSEITVLADSNDGIDNPAGIVIGGHESEHDLFVSNFAYITNNAGLEANPSIVKISDVVKETELDERDENSAHVETAISAKFPFESKYVDVNGVSMHYIEQGEGTPILFIHGIPTSSYLWRNVIPHVSKNGRAIAMDLAGFGRSETPPESPQTFAIQTQYVDGFIEALGLKDIILVVHDWGGFPGLDWAARHPDRIRGLVFMEVLVDLIESSCFFPNCEPFPIPPWAPIEMGQQAIVENNLFADVLPMATMQPMSNEILRNYTKLFNSPARRQIFLDLESDLPVVGTNRHDSLQRVTRYAKWLQESSTPKLLFYATPGFAIRTDNGMLDKALTAPNITAIDLGAGIHFFQESQPRKIGSGISHWIDEQKLENSDN